MRVDDAEGLSALTAAEAAAEIARGSLTAEAYAEACLDRIARVDDDVGAFIHLDPKHVLAQARALDRRKASGLPLGKLHGIPVALKDNIDSADYPAEYGSPLLTGRHPARDATVVARLHAAGAVIVGKTVTTEFAFFHPGKTRNPRDLARTPGGSSSGSAAAVAAGMVPLALGTQTNGSVIRPASFCGVYSMKPSFGLVSRTGVLRTSRTLDHVGPFARSLGDIALVLEVLAGHDPADLDTGMEPPPEFRSVAARSFLRAPRLAFVRTPKWDAADAATRAAFEHFVEALGSACVALDLPDRFAAAWDTLRTIMAAEMAHNLAPVTDNGGERVSTVLRDLIAEGRQVTAARYLSAKDEAEALSVLLAEIFEGFDAVVTPASLGVAPLGLESTGSPLFCSLWTLTGLPALSLPLLKGEAGLPLGVQLVGAKQQDARLLHHARWLVEAAGKNSGRSLGS
jgi:Asp-tRNA(Asn)/Glu-tRNA(Gln) amidotransferase A subunit family amidase